MRLLLGRALGSPMALGLILAAVLASYGWVYWKGHNAASTAYKARIDAATHELDVQLSKARARLQMRDAELQSLAARLARSGVDNDRLALADSGACNITPDGMQRLLGHWGPVPQR